SFFHDQTAVMGFAGTFPHLAFARSEGASVVFDGSK
uniref:Uncharacterized protein n=1 Tax=Aegilops tauschii subsp. strangulata TaxID=200361 RepID=A0A453MB78_AEGTS